MPAGYSFDQVIKKYSKMDAQDKSVTLDPDKLNQLTLSDNFCNIRYLNQDNLCNVKCLNQASNFCNVRYLNQAEDNQEKTVQDDISEDNLEDSSDDDKDEFVFDKAVNNTLKGSNQSNIRLNKANSAFQAKLNASLAIKQLSIQSTSYHLIT